MLPPLNLELFDRIKAHLRAHPEQLDMDCWAQTLGPDCGTVACIAGWACLLEDLVRPGESVHSRPNATPKGWALADRHAICCGVQDLGGAALGLTASEANNLFFVLNWPLELQRRYAVDSVEVVCAMIDLTIQKGTRTRTLVSSFSSETV